MPRPRTIDHAAAIALLLEGHTQTSASRKLGCSRSVIRWVSERYRADYPALAPKLRPPKVVRQPLRVMPRFVRVPDEFRSAGLAEDYEDLVRDFGDVEGERRCRRLLEETRRLEALDAQMGRAA